MDSFYPLFTDLGIWVSFLLSLFIFSLLVGDNVMARLAQHILVGASMGYIVILAVQHVLRPRLFIPLFSGQISDLWLLFPLFLGISLLLAGTDRVLQYRTTEQNRSTISSSSYFRSILRGLGAIPVALMIGVSIGVAITGAIQGTVLPQFWQSIHMGLPWGESGLVFFTGLLSLLITMGTLLHLFGNSEHIYPERPPWIGRMLAAWTWLGKRSLWLATGVIFARLVVARYSLLIARILFLRQSLEEIGLWGLAESIWQSLTR